MAKLQVPQFWYSTDANDTSPFMASLLSPIASLYQMGSKLDRAITRTHKSPLPVICVGNLTMGGAGKTPTSRAILKIIQNHGKFVTPCFLMRGYGGANKGPKEVDNSIHTCWDVGDEALMQSHYAPVIVSNNRYKGALLAEKLGYDIIIMDDGFQNQTLEKDLSFIAIDGGFGFGNGRCFPSGPLREPVAEGLKRADAAIVINKTTDTNLQPLGDFKQFDGTIILDDGDDRPGPNGQYIAFAGIARPEKFFKTLEDNGFNLRAHYTYPDHHIYTRNELLKLAERAESIDTTMITTEKDWIRLTTNWRKKIAYMTISIKLGDDFKTYLNDKLDNL